MTGASARANLLVMFDYDPVTSARVRERVDRLEIPFGDHGIDPYGIGKGELGFGFSLIELLYKYYFWVDSYGLENVPPRGRVMLVGNHSGGVAIDGVMVMATCFFELDPPRLAQGMAEKFIVRVPGFGSLTTRMGQFPGLPEHAKRLLEDERMLMVFPEGARGTAKLARDADTLVRFGTGFMRLALETKTPIVPFGFVGAGEAMPTVANLYALAKLMGVPYIPVTRYLLPVPKPTIFQLLFGKPLVFEGTGKESDDEIETRVEQVKSAIGRLVGQGRAIREKKITPEELTIQ
jgi:1-acyl-sn-glycerol-3-phosphate acyltransferase